MDQFTPERTVGEIVAERASRSRVFERYHIDYCCGGKKTLGESCAAKGLSVSIVASDLAESDRAEEPDDVDLRSMSLGELADYIERTFHASLRESLPRLTALTAKVAAVHGAGNARLVELAEVFVAFRRDMEEHTAKEEVILFPMCHKLDTATSMPSFHCGAIANPIRVMLAEHDGAGAALERMRELTDGFVAPGHACNTYRAMLDGLAALEAETHRHVHAENEILFPNSIAREESFALASAAH
ncbi:MAG: iron-sulfur cluster repair di-iron protein [Capsulimonadaceae bacterium]|nr:iron-sulfur cluster repair di-iron protein [Capsulimonadaceae bacterium]